MRTSFIVVNGGLLAVDILPAFPPPLLYCIHIQRYSQTIFALEFCNVMSLVSLTVYLL